MNILCNEAISKTVNFENLHMPGNTPPSPITIDTVLGDMAMWFLEGKDTARKIEMAFRAMMKQGSEQIDFLIKQCKRESKIKKMDMNYAEEVVAKNKIQVVFKESKIHFSRVQRNLAELKDTEYLAHFLEKHHVHFTDLNIKTRDIFRELKSGIEKPCDSNCSILALCNDGTCDSGCSSGNNSGSNSCEESDISSNDSCESDSSDNENHRIMSRMDQHDRDFKKWYNIYLTFKTETHNYRLIKNAYEKI